MTWRLLIEDGVEAAKGLAVDDALAERVGTGRSRPTLRLYTYRPHAALVGRFQDVGHEVHRVFCQSYGIEINRRPTGGGAILMGPDQLGVALTLPGRGAHRIDRPRKLMAGFSRGITSSLESLGIEARFRGKNDLEVGGKKLAGLGLHRSPSGGLLFHASLLVDLDVGLMTRVLATPIAPDETTADEVDIVAGRTTTLRRLLDSPIGMGEVRRCVAEGFAEAFSTALEAGALDAEEESAVADVERDRYGNDEWIHRSGTVPDTAGAADLRTPAGRLRVTVSMSGGIIKSIYLRGDFFSSEGAVADLEGSLRWHSSSPLELLETLREVRERHPADLADLVPEDLGRVIDSAVARARSPIGDPRPYGCFVTPEASVDSQ